MEISGKITAVEVSLDGRVWHPLPVEVIVPARIAVRTTFDIATPNLAQVRNILTLTYGEEVSVFESDIGTVGTGLYFFQFPLDFPMGLPGPVMGRSEILARLAGEEEWRTLDAWEGKLADISYKLLGQILRVGRRIDEALTPLPFSVLAGERFLLGMEGIIQVPEPGSMALRTEVYTPLGEIVRRELVEEITRPAAFTWSTDLELSGLESPGMYPGRVQLLFDGTLLHAIEQRLFEVTVVPVEAPAPPPLEPMMTVIGIIALFTTLGAITLAIIRGVRR